MRTFPSSEYIHKRGCPRKLQLYPFRLWRDTDQQFGPVSIGDLSSNILISFRSRTRISSASSASPETSSREITTAPRFRDRKSVKIKNDCTTGPFVPSWRTINFERENGWNLMKDSRRSERPVILVFTWPFASNDRPLIALIHGKRRGWPLRRRWTDNVRKFWVIW